jgi:hypothetical protein
VLIKSWVDRGMPAGSWTMLRFAGWSQFVSGVLENVGFTDVGKNIEAYLADKGDDRNSGLHFVEHLWKQFGDKTEWSIREALEASRNPMNSEELLFPELTPGVNSRTPGGVMTALGKYVRRELVGRVFNLADGTVHIVHVREKNPARYLFKRR